VKVEPKRLAQALAAAYGASTPRPLSLVRQVPCPACAGAMRTMTVCKPCAGTGRVMVIA
jgi:DnaJ-class molecular chaperone